MAVQALAHVGVRGSYNAEGELTKLFHIQFLVEKVTLGRIDPNLVTLIKYSGYQDFEAVQSPAIVMLLHGWRQTVPAKKSHYFALKFFINTYRR